MRAESYGVYGRRMMHALLRRHGWDVGRDQTARLMRLAGGRGLRRSKRVFTTKLDPAATKPADLVQRRFTAPAPRRLWVADVTYVPTWAGFAYVAFVIDVYSRRIVGRNVAATLTTELLTLRALDMAAWAAGGNLDGLIRQRGPWRTIEQVQLATLEYVWWWNSQRLHGELDMRTPAEVEQAYYADLESTQPAPTGQGTR